MPEQLLHGANIPHPLQPVSGKGVPKRVTGSRLADSRIPQALFDGALQYILTQKVSSGFSTSRITRGLVGRKQIVPTEGPGGVGILSFQGEGKVDCSKAIGKVLLMDDAHPFNLAPQRPHHWIRHYRHPVLAPLAAAHHDLPPLELDIVHSQTKAFAQPEPRSIKQTRHQPFSPGKSSQQEIHLGRRKHHRQPLRFPRPRDTVESGQVPLEEMSIENKQRAESMILGGRRHIPVDCQVSKESLVLSLTHVERMAFAANENESANPVNVRLFRTNTLTPGANCRPNPIEQTRFLHAHNASPFTILI